MSASAILLPPDAQANDDFAAVQRCVARLLATKQEDFALWIEAERVLKTPLPVVMIAATQQAAAMTFSMTSVLAPQRREAMALAMLKNQSDTVRQLLLDQRAGAFPAALNAQTQEGGNG